MTNDNERIEERSEMAERPVRPYRPWLWSLAACVKAGGTLVAFLLALRTGWPGIVTLGAAITGLLLSQLLEATSHGD